MKSLLVLAAVLAGCSTTPLTTSEVIGKTEIQHDPATSVTSYTGPACDGVVLRAWKSEGRDVSYMLLVTTSSSSPVSYTRATDHDGVDLPIEYTNVNVDCSSSTCKYTEQIGLGVSRQYLENSTRFGVNFRLYGGGHDELFYFLGDYVTGMLKATKE